jgi:hypothetical protein
MLEPDSFIDSNDYCHVQPGEYSENGILFSAYVNIMTDLTLTPKNTQKITDGKVWFDPNPDDMNKPDCHFSHDNMSAMYFFATRDSVKNLPTCYWNGRIRTIHPRDLIFYTMIKRRWKFLQILLVPDMFVSLLRPPTDTSGKLLWLMRSITIINKLGSSFLFNIYMWYMADKLNAALYMYFKNPNHPIHTRRLTE